MHWKSGSMQVDISAGFVEWASQRGNPLNGTVNSGYESLSFRLLANKSRYRILQDGTKWNLFDRINLYLLLKNEKEDPLYSCIASVRHPAIPRPRKMRKDCYIFWRTASFFKKKTQDVTKIKHCWRESYKNLLFRNIFNFLFGVFMETDDVITKTISRMFQLC